MAESIIKVIVSDQIGASSNLNDLSVQTGIITTKDQTVSNPATKSNNKFSKNLYGVYQVAKTISNQVVANVGTYTGDSILQNKINNMQAASQLAFTAVLSPTAALSTIAISSFSTIWNENHRRRMEEINLANQRAKNGYSDSASILTSRRH